LLVFGLNDVLPFSSMATHQLEQHLTQGGNDDSAEALLTFFFRYGSVRKTSAAIERPSRTRLTQEVIVTTADGRSTEMGSCFAIRSIVKLFELCYHTLHRTLGAEWNERQSLLQFILNPAKLELSRCQSKRQAFWCAK
jgi:hypothetical protein